MDKINRDQIQREKVERARKEATEHNAKILPETPGYVRTEGPRRQFYCEVDSSGRKTWIEI